MGLARPLSRLCPIDRARPTPYRALRRLCAGRPVQARHGISPIVMKASPVPGRLAGSHPTLLGWLLD